MLFSIGYANKPLNEFIEILKKNNITCIVDVRSTASSKQFPEYNANALKNKLKEHNISYLQFSREFGARRSEPDVYKRVKLYNNENIEVVIFDKVWELSIFKIGVQRILDGMAKDLNICFMCSEKNPVQCHRTIMVSEYFNRLYNIDIFHIIDSNSMLKHSEINNYLQKIFEEARTKFNELHRQELLYYGNLFNQTTQNEFIEKWNDFFSMYTLEKGYYLQNLLIGYRKGEEEYD